MMSCTAGHRGRKFGHSVSVETRIKMSAAKRGRKFTLEHRAAISIARKGYAQTLDHRAKVSAIKKRHTTQKINDCKCVVHTRYHSSVLTKRMVKIFLNEFPEVIQEQHFGRYSVDAYLPLPYHLAFEADGGYWHNLLGAPERDAKRDTYLLRKFNLPVIRLTEQEINNANQVE